MFTLGTRFKRGYKLNKTNSILKDTIDTWLHMWKNPIAYTTIQRELGFIVANNRTIWN